MSLKELLQQETSLFSFEFFPAKDAEGEARLCDVINELKILKPSFVSVTYGAMGTNQDRTLALVKKIKQEINLQVMVHLTCIGATEAKIDAFLDEIHQAGIRNILALRGDVPDGVSKEEAFKGAYKYANELVRAIKAKSSDFSVAVAGYPEGHVEAESFDADIDALKRKVDLGADVVFTQLFFNNDNFYRFCDRARTEGITVPIIPGIMPAQSAKQLEIFSSKCGVAIPQNIRDFFARDNISLDDRKIFGIAYATEQCRDLLKNNAKGIHFYTLNKSDATRMIHAALQ